jgi:hypothetical protein
VPRVRGLSCTTFRSRVEAFKGWLDLVCTALDRRSYHRVCSERSEASPVVRHHHHHHYPPHPSPPSPASIAPLLTPGVPLQVPGRHAVRGHRGLGPVARRGVLHRGSPAQEEGLLPIRPGAPRLTYPLLTHGFCMQHQVTRCAILAAIDNDSSWSVSGPTIPPGRGLTPDARSTTGQGDLPAGQGLPPRLRGARQGQDGPAARGPPARHRTQPPRQRHAPVTAQ